MVHEETTLGRVGEGGEEAPDEREPFTAWVGRVGREPAVAQHKHLPLAVAESPHGLLGREKGLLGHRLPPPQHG